MGRWPGTGKITVEECPFISIFMLARRGLLSGLKATGLTWTSSYGDVTKVTLAINIDEERPNRNLMMLFYALTDSYTGEKIKLEYKVDITDTSCHLGGVRYWFICPVPNCRRRVGKLYLPSGAKYFGCRHCYDLTYRSCQEHSKKVDFFKRNPDILAAHLKSKNPNVFCSALLAYAKIIG